MTENNATRILEIMSSFDADNNAILIGRLLQMCGIGKSTGYGLINAMTEEGLLERSGRGSVRLGTGAIIFAHMVRGHHHTELQNLRMKLPSPRRTTGGEIEFEHFENVHLTKVVDCKKYYRPGPWKIGFANASVSNPWRKALLASIKLAFEQRPSTFSQLIVHDARDSVGKQVAGIGELLSQDVDLLLYSAVDTNCKDIEKPLIAAMDANIPIIAVDRRLDNPTCHLAFVTSSDRYIGHTSALWLAEYIGGKGTIWMLSGDLATTPARRRKDAALDVFSRFPDIRIAASADTRWHYEVARETVHDLIDKCPVPDGVWCDSGLQGTGSIDAFQQAGFKKGEIPPHTGGDVNGMYRRVLELKIPSVGIDYPASIGQRAVLAAIDVLSGRPVTERIETEMNVVLPRGMETASVRADNWTELYVRWDMPDDFIPSHGRGWDFKSPRATRQ